MDVVSNMIETCETSEWECAFLRFLFNDLERVPAQCFLFPRFQQSIKGLGSVAGSLRHQAIFIIFEHRCILALWM